MQEYTALLNVYVLSAKASIIEASQNENFVISCTVW